MTLYDHGLGAPAERVPVDQEARDRVRGDLARNLFVEAGAGTGKTKVLVDRVVRLVATGTVREPSGLVAITFTEAAAAELRDRIRAELERAVAGTTLDDDERERCRTMRNRIDEAVITTLHGFAQRILSEHPLEAGLPPTFEVDDGVASSVRFAERWRAFCDDLFGDPNAEGDLLLAHALNLGTVRLRDVAQHFHDRWDRVVEADLPVPSIPRFDLEPILGPVREAVALAGPRRHDPDDILADVVRQWESVAALLEEGLAAGDELEAVRTLAAFALRNPGTYGKRALWGDDKGAIADLGSRGRDASFALLTDLRRVALERMLPRLRAFTVAGVEERRAQGRLEFHDLLVHARNLLRADARVRAGLASRIDVILIDEFQDTDPIQLDIAFLLAAADPTAPPKPWTAAELAPGKLLIVGDPKQSIYGFRGADISLWDRARSRFGADVVRLDQNFRTVPQLLGWVNEVFAEVIADGEEGLQPSFERLAAFRPDLREGPAVVVVGGPVDKLPAAELRDREASDLAKLIVSLRADRVTVSDADDPDGAPRPLRFDDIALLVPTRTPLAQLERALDQHDIPYRVESRSLVWATDAVRELLSVLAAIDDPADEVSLVAALRSPGFACSDVDLIEWHEAGGRWDHKGSPPEAIDPEHPVRRAMAALRLFHEERGDVPVNELVERVVRERRLVELTFAQRRPRDHWRRLRFVIDQARAFVEGGGGSVGEFVAWARLQGDEGAQVVETPAPEPDDDAVRILTIHGSKGLEFPVVVLAGLASSGRDNGPWVRWGDRPEVALGAKEQRFATSGFAAASETAADAQVHEGRRLLYVAATRARDHLVVSLHHSTRGQTTHARELWAACGKAAVAGTWEPAEIPEQMALPVAVPVTGPEPATAEERASWLAAHQAVLASAERQRVLSATAVAGAAHAHDDESSPVPPPTVFRRGGTAIGRAVHAVLQTADLADPGDLRAIAAVHAAAEGVPDAEEQVAALAASALGSPVVLDARTSPRRWREVAVAAPIDGDNVVEGYIDLLFEDAAGGLVVVDYKTDRARSDAELDAAMSRYRLQAAAYALALEATLGRPVARAVFVFARIGAAVEREVTDLPAAVAEARALVTS